MILTISVCTYQNGQFDVILRDKAAGKEITFSGERKVSSEDHEFLNRIAPACVWTDYQRITPED
jgi:hypothetical protein